MKRSLKWDDQVLAGFELAELITSLESTHPLVGTGKDLFLNHWSEDTIDQGETMS